LQALQRRQWARKTTASNTMVAESDSPVEASDMWRSVSSFTKDWAPQGTRQMPNAQCSMLNAGWLPGAFFGYQAHRKTMLHELTARPRWGTGISRAAASVSVFLMFCG